MTQQKQRPHTTNNGERAKSKIVKLPDAVWAPTTAGLLMLIAGLLGLAFRQPWIFPSLGPTAFLQAEQPDQPTAKFYNTVVGHLVGLGAGLFAVAVLGAVSAPSVLSTGELTAVRVWASVLAVVLNLLLGLLFKASHPPAAATTLLVSLGGFKPTWHDVGTVVIGVLIVAIAGEAIRQIRVKSKAP